MSRSTTVALKLDISLLQVWTFGTRLDETASPHTTRHRWNKEVWRRILHCTERELNKDNKDEYLRKG